MAIKREQKNRVNASGTFDVIHYETDASQVLMADGTTAEKKIATKADLVNGVVPSDQLPAETDPTVPDWAKQPNKPNYTANEVGALPNTTPIPSSLSDLTDDATHRLVTDDEKTAWSAKATKPKAILVTLPASGWDDTAMTQTVTVSGVLADATKQNVNISLADRASSNAWVDADIWCDAQGADSLTFSCETVPTADINLNIEIVEVTAG